VQFAELFVGALAAYPAVGVAFAIAFVLSALAESTQLPSTRPSVFGSSSCPE